MRIYSFLNKIPKKPKERKVKLPVLVPILYNFTQNNPFRLSRREINILFEFVYEVTHEFCPRAVPMPLPVMQQMQTPPPNVAGGVMQSKNPTNPTPSTGTTSQAGSASSSATAAPTAVPWTVGSGARPKQTFYGSGRGRGQNTAQSGTRVGRAITGQSASTSAASTSAASAKQLASAANRGIAAAYTGKYVKTLKDT